MSDITVIYGSTTGSTESAAHKIAEKLGAACINITQASANDFQSPVLILGTSTWGCGDLQDDWQAGLPLLEQVDWKNKQAALFGQGDQYGFGDTYLDGMGTLCQTILAHGARLIGKTSAKEFAHSASLAQQDDQFCGLALDDTNESELTNARIDAWVAQLKTELGSKH